MLGVSLTRVGVCGYRLTEFSGLMAELSLVKQYFPRSDY